MKSVLIFMGLALVVLGGCRSIPGCPTSFCDYKSDLTYYGRNVAFVYEDTFREQYSSCVLRTELVTGVYVPSTLQEATTILRNMAGELSANVVVFQTFRRNVDGTGRAYVCPTASNQNRVSQATQPSNSNQIRNTQFDNQSSNQVINTTINTSQQTPISPNATVSDAGRKLTWQTCSMGQSHQGGRCTGNAAVASLSGAASYCNSISTAGYAYRLPDRLELLSIIKEGQSGARVDPKIFPDTKPDIYWTRESYNSSPITNWVVDFGAGGSFGYGTENQANVRCVANAP